MPMCNLLEYSHNYSITSGGWWNYIIETGSVILMLKKKQQEIAGQTQERLAQTGNPEDTDQLTQPPLPSLNVEVTISLLEIFGDLLIYLW